MTHRIVVLGGGYAGLTTAKRLGRLLPDAHITLVNERERFVHRILLHQAAAGRDLDAPRLADLLRGTNVELVVGRAAGIDVERRQVAVVGAERRNSPSRAAPRPPTKQGGVSVTTEGSADTASPGSSSRSRVPQGAETTGATSIGYDSGTPRGASSPRVPQGSEAVIGYDTLVYALGSVGDMTRVPGVAEHAYGVSGRDEAAALRDAVARNDSGTVTVVGAGLTGAELACELAGRHPRARVRLVSRGEAGGWLSPRGKRHARAAFRRLGIEVMSGVGVTAVKDGAVVVDGGSVADSDVTVWAGGFTAPPLAAEAGLDVDGLGRIPIDDTMRTLARPEIYAIGDSAAFTSRHGNELRMACAAAIPMAWHAADVIAARLSGRSVPPFHFRFVQQAIGLGPGDGLVQYVRPDDSMVNAVLTGRTAARYKDFVCWFVAKTLPHTGPYTPRRRHPMLPRPQVPVG
ncbi:MAG TPA: FAD-dependent oxidoreductase [Stackebrandtia sp.]|uniref:NAD(P)/FAD-dependent oxidoreductase n=1 Tax=Stackebrandtia sp. TaxID=2023065 RepID=UPI002D41CE85|nr:FAD-dependent oxidoreductase [Stackebrandtia sp.]HZE37312.1 FAD-dependent oxidoreductase [Stackebrandtia sp.]